MSERAASGSIYDLGYRNYEGARLGRSHAVLALYLHSLKGIFGLGRRTSAKIFPIGLAIVTLIPAAIQLGIASVANDIIEVFRAEEYYGYVQVTLALFCAAVAPEVVGRDQRRNTLSLYFSRALQREDYVFAKYAALMTAMLVLTVGPQAVLFIGNGFAQNDLGGYFADEWDQIPPILVSAVLVSGMIAGVSLVIAAQTPRRAYSTVGILAAFLLSWTIASIIFETSDPDVGRFVLLLSPFHLMRGFTLWLFGADAPAGEPIAEADLPGAIWAIVAAAAALFALALIIRRYQRVQA